MNLGPIFFLTTTGLTFCTFESYDSIAFDDTEYYKHMAHCAISTARVCSSYCMYGVLCLSLFFSLCVGVGGSPIIVIW